MSTVERLLLAAAFVACLAGPALAAPVKNAVCLSCHDHVMNGKVKHPIAEKLCTACHVYHGDNPAGPIQLTAEVGKLCLVCHRILPVSHDSGPGRRGFGGPHPTCGGNDPLYPKRSFNCISCHNPHSSDQPGLFRYPVSSGAPQYGQACRVCHWDIGYTGPKPPRPLWNPYP